MKIFTIVVILMQFPCLLAKDHLSRLFYAKGDVKILRNSSVVAVKKNMTLKSGDIVITGKKGLAIIRSITTTYKIAPNSRIQLDLSVPEVINSKIDYGIAVIQFLKKKFLDKLPTKLTVDTRHASIGVRGTRFFAYVSLKSSNSILSVESGVVSYKNKKYKEEADISKNKSVMTNKKHRILRPRKFGFESKINWILDDSNEEIGHRPGLVSALEKTWEKYKDEDAKLWNKRSEEMKNVWENAYNK